MAVGTMANPLNKLKKMRGRSWDEIRTRGGQAVLAYSEKIGFGGRIPTDDEFARLVDKEQFGTAPVIADSLWQSFYTNADERFFPSFRRPVDSAYKFRTAFPAAAIHFIAAAERILDGRIDILGLKNLNIGTEIDWHLEPVSGIRSPLKHWKQFDELDTAECGDKKIVWEINRHQHFFTLGIAYWLTRDERFADVFVKHLESWMEQNPPGSGVNWSSSLEVAFRAMSWIWSFQFFRNADDFSPELFKKALKYLYLHGRHIEKYLSKYYSPNTHLTGEALALYYLGTQLPFLERAAHWRKLGEEILLAEIEKQILDDGVYFEQSTWYQRYTVDFYTQFVVLKSLSDDGSSNGTSRKLETRLQSALEFLMHVTRPDGTTPIIGDDDGGLALPLTTAAADDFRGTLAAGAALFGRGDLKSVAGGEREEVFWLFGADGLSYALIDEDEPAAASKDFRNGGYFAMRDGWLDTDNYLLVDCGPVGAIAGGHGHADALSIEVALQGRTLLVDSGTYTYHESREMRDYFRSTKAHNTVTIDERSSSEPGSIFGWKTRADAQVHSWITDDRFDYFEGSHTGYSRLENAATHERSILFLKNDYIIMRDLVRTRGEHEHSLNFHFPADSKAAVDAAGDFAGGDDWRMFTFGDGGRWQTRESWISNSYSSKTNAPFLMFASKGRGTQEFFTFILPADAGFAKPEVTEVPIDGGRAFAILYRGYTDLFVFNDEHRNTVRTELFDTNFRVTWGRVSGRTGTPEEFVLIGGSKFEIDGTEILGDSGELSFATIRRMGKDLNVNTGKGRFRVSLP